MQQGFQSFCTGLGNKSLIPLYVSPGQEWHRRAMSLHSVMNAVLFRRLKDDYSHLTTLANAIYQYEVWVKGIDTLTTSSCLGYCQVRDHVWVKVPQSWCTTNFGNGQVTKIVSTQSCAVDGMPHHVKDLYLCLSITMSEENFNSTTILESQSESLLHDNGDTVKQFTPSPLLQKSTQRR